jgi:diadenosine tetraphosphate (Ap4A) HIT family hydrolase
MATEGKLAQECILCDIDPATNKTFIKSYEYYTVLANFKQPTLGAVLIVLDRHIPKLSDWNIDERAEYPIVVDDVENALEQAFQPDRINHEMLANKVNHVHWHVVPRYQHERVFANNTWSDENYGVRAKLNMPEKGQIIIEQVVAELQKHL